VCNALQTPFEPVLQKIASVLVTLESESEYLYKEKTQVLARIMPCGMSFGMTIVEILLP
jgi:hypothetical protein